MVQWAKKSARHDLFFFSVVGHDKKRYALPGCKHNQISAKNTSILFHNHEKTVAYE